DTVVTNEDVAVGGNVLANDTDVDGDALTATLVTGPGHGTLVFNADGTFTYTPALNFNGADKFTYVANDGTANGNVATVNITVTPVNDPPVAKNDSVTTAEDTAVKGAVLANDTDVDGDILTASLVGGPANGTLVFNPDGTFTYTPNANFSGTDSFSYKANDGTADSNVATVAITVTPVPDAPSLTVSPASGAEDTAIPLSIAAALTDPSEQLTISIVGVPAGAALSAGTKNADGSWTLTAPQLAGLAITPPLNSSNDFTLTVTATSREPGLSGPGSTASVTDTLPVTVTPVADQPNFTVGSSVVITAPNQTISGTQANDVIVGGFGSDNISGLDGNDLISGDPPAGAQSAPLSIAASVTDTDGSEALEIDISKLPAGATLSAGTQNPDGTWTLTPAQLAGLQLNVQPGTAPFDMTVSAVVTDRGPDDVVPDTLTVQHSIHVDISGVPNDSLSGGGGADTLLGFAGNDSLQGGPGADVLDGGVGNDIIRDDDGAVARGGDGNDTIDITYNSVSAAVEIEGGAGNDTITIQLNNNVDLGAFGGVQFYADSSDPTAPSGDDVVTIKGQFINGTSGNTGIFLGGGNDLFTDQAQSTIRVDAGDGNDTLNGSPVSDSMSGGAGNDIIIGGGGNGNDSLDGGSGDDSISGSLGSDLITTGDGNDTVFASQGADTITLGSGHDLLIYKDILDGPDSIGGFDKTAGGSSQDTIDLDALFDSRGIASNDRAGRVSFVQVGGDVQLHVNVGFDVTVLTFKGMPDTTGLTVGNAATDDVHVGSL
ncbi:MAG TPA: tandem-95 repeat protein, partial [Methylomirabilota bacterium]|nr:tandem-95 repeat protein [Methylomirabilota bacterium]